MLIADATNHTVMQHVTQYFPVLAILSYFAQFCHKLGQRFSFLLPGIKLVPLDDRRRLWVEVFCRSCDYLLESQVSDLFGQCQHLDQPVRGRAHSVLEDGSPLDLGSDIVCCEVVFQTLSVLASLFSLAIEWNHCAVQSNGCYMCCCEQFDWQGCRHGSSLLCLCLLVAIL